MVEVEDKAQAAADKVGRHVAENDVMGRTLGVVLEEIRPGYARARMTVCPDMANAAGIGHGGATFTLADVVFGASCNSHNKLALAQNCNITFLAPVELGDVLIAEGREVSQQGRGGVYDIVVSNQDGMQVALFRGLSRQTGTKMID